jgi:NitT/TauT family transport system ATP-binding protein
MNLRAWIRVGPNEFVTRNLPVLLAPLVAVKPPYYWSIAGLHPLSSGDVLLDGQKVTAPYPQIGMVFQEANLLPWRNLTKYIQFPFEIRKEKVDEKHIEHLLEQVGLTGFGNKFPRKRHL